MPRPWRPQLRTMAITPYINAKDPTLATYTAEDAEARAKAMRGA
jgi:hypothetical protein